jgi:putative Mg2+ transporter-C (MgtC) family protein
MSWLEALFIQTDINPGTILLRLLLSFLLGGLIGWERERRNQQAGLRTHMLICLGATLLMLTSIFIPQTFQSFKNGDPGRIAAQVVSGIGFLGGGAIFKLGSTVKGLTTAATIWVVAAIGLAVGAGLYTGASICTGFILFVLVILTKVEKKYFSPKVTKSLRLSFQTMNLEIDDVFRMLEKSAVKVLSVNIHQLAEKKQTDLRLVIQLPQKTSVKKLYKDLATIDRITEFSLGQEL